MPAILSSSKPESLRVRRHGIATALFLILLISITFGCQTPATTLEPTWVDDSQKGVSYSKIVVIGAFSRDLYADLVEGDLVDQLQKRGIAAVAGAPVMKDLGFNATKRKSERVGRALKEIGYDGVLVVRFLELDQKIERTQPSGTKLETGKVGRLSTEDAPIGSYETGSSPYYTFSTFSSYQTQTKRTVYDPGKFKTTSTNVVYETNFYSLNTGELVWTAHSTTVDPRSTKSFSRSFSAAVVNQLIADRVLQAGAN